MKYSWTFSTTVIFFRPEGDRCGEVQLYLTSTSCLTSTIFITEK